MKGAVPPPACTTWAGTKSNHDPTTVLPALASTYTRTVCLSVPVPFLTVPMTQASVPT